MTNRNQTFYEIMRRRNSGSAYPNTVQCTFLPTLTTSTLAFIQDPSVSVLPLPAEWRWKKILSLTSPNKLHRDQKGLWYYEYLEPWWNDTDSRKPNNLQINLPQCYFIHHKSHMDWPEREPRPLLWVAGDWPPEIRQFFLCISCIKF
jgi:hypothetical protein